LGEAAIGRKRGADALRVTPRRRLTGLVAALLFEALVVLALLTLGTRRTVPMAEDRPLSTFDVTEPEAEPTDVQKPEPAKQAKKETSTTPPLPTPVAVTPPPPATVKVPEPVVKLPSPVVTLPADQMASADLRNFPPAKPRGPAGPPAPRGEADSEVVGRAPNGERLYAAAWLREPYDSELRGYLSTADPGWALIACKTVPDYKVDDCVALDEWPNGSRLARAVLAAAWQFKVKPPRVGGSYKVGEWVRIRIDYGIKGRG
jgi:protein TonB